MAVASSSSVVLKGAGGRGKQRTGQAAQDAAALAEWNSRKWVWIPDDHNGYTAGWVVKTEGEIATVALESGEELRQVSAIDLYRLNPPNYDGAEDIADLTYLNEASVVHNLKTRYTDGSIYTYSGLFLVAINPYQPLPIYTPAVVESYKNSRRDENAPHVFAVAERAWQNMVAHRDQSQSVLVTGESGAGKTENTKRVIQYLAAIAASSTSGGVSSSPSNDMLARTESIQGGGVRPIKKLGQLERQILEANPILESFGNAQTVKNNNSSRFGKFVRIYFNPVGAIAGANIDWYLLEKSRVTSRSQQERSFHIFFQLLRGADETMKKQLLLDGKRSEHFNYLRSSRQEVEGVDDNAEWKALQHALDTVGFSTEEKLKLFRVISAILHLGNVDVGGDRSDQAHIRDIGQLEKICFLLGIRDSSELLNALVRPKVKAGREWVVQARTMKQVVDELAALSKALYEKNFGAMVERINKALGRPSTRTFIGVLDIAGFEIFETNGFEQLCINYTNEKLQQFFNHHMFVLEQEEYSREEIDWQYVNFGLELQPTIDLIESNNPMGILSCLDDACIMPKSTDATYTAKLNELAQQKPVAKQFTKYAAARFEQGFKVSHYAGTVEYRTEGWLDKNRDPLNDNLTSLLANSTDPYIAELFSDFAEAEPPTSSDVPRSRVRRGAFRTVGQRHKDQLSFLMSQLRETQPHFVRCIVPNLTKSPGIIDTRLVLDQLRCNGVLEGIRIARLGYPNRLPFSEFRRRFELLTPLLIQKDFVDGAKACERILKALELDTQTYKLGLTKVFFKSGILAELEEHRDEHLSLIFTKVQAACRKFTARRQAKKILHRAAAVRTIQRNARLYIQLKQWPWWPLFQRVRPLLAAARNDDEMRRREDELVAIKEKAARDAAERERLETLKSELEAAKASIEKSLASERTLAAEKDALLLRSKEREAAMEDELEAMANDFKLVESQLDRAMTAKGNTEKQVSQLHEAYANQSRLMETLQLEQTAWKAKQAEMATHTSMKTAEWEKLMANKNEASAAISSLKIQLSEQRQDLQREQARSRAMLSETEAKLAKEAKIANDLRTQLSTFESDAGRVRSEIADLQRDRRKAEAKIQSLTAELENTKNDQKSSNAKHSTALTAISGLENQLTRVKQEASDAQRQLNTDKAARTAAEKDLSALKKLLEDKISDHQRQSELSRVKEAEVQELRGQSSRSAADLARLQRDSSAVQQRLRRELDLAKQDIADSKFKNADLSKQLALASTRLSEFEGVKLDVERQQQEHELRVELIRTEIAEVHLKEREKLEKQISELKGRTLLLEDLVLKCTRERDSAKRDVGVLKTSLAAEQEAVAERDSFKKSLEDKIDQQHLVLADLDKINGNLRSELLATKARLKVAEDKAGRTVVEHIRVLEEAQRLQNADMDRMRADRDQRDAYVRTLERAKTALTQSLEDLQHEREAERRQAWTNKPAKDTSFSQAHEALQSEKKLRELAELNVTRLQSEIRHQQEQLAEAAREAAELRREKAQFEKDLHSVAASDHTESMSYPRRMQESRAANVLPSTPPSRGMNTPPPKLTNVGGIKNSTSFLHSPASPRRKNYE